MLVGGEGGFGKERGVARAVTYLSRDAEEAASGCRLDLIESLRYLKSLRRARESGRVRGRVCVCDRVPAKREEGEDNLLELREASWSFALYLHSHKKITNPETSI